MTICITKDKIQFTNYALFATGSGIKVKGGVFSSRGCLPKFDSTPEQGTVAGFFAGGYLSPGSTSEIERSPFASDTNAACVGSVSSGIYMAAGNQSTVCGFVSGGRNPGGSITSNNRRFPFASLGATSDNGNLTVGRASMTGVSSKDFGYVAGGTTGPSSTNVIDKFPFPTGGNSTDVGDLYSSTQEVFSGIGSSNYGYVGGGNGTTVVSKWPFAADVSASCNGNLQGGVSPSVEGPGGSSSQECGYFLGAFQSPNNAAVEKFPFAADAAIFNVGSLSTGRGYTESAGSTTHGYVAGGGVGGVPVFNTIDKFSYASEGTATGVGVLTQCSRFKAGFMD